MRDKVAHQLHHLLACCGLLVEQRQGCGSFAAQDRVRKGGNRLLARESKDIEHVTFSDGFAAKSNQLIEHRLCVAQSTVRSTRDRVRRRRFQLHFLLFRDELEMVSDQIRRNAMKIETLATTQDG